MERPYQPLLFILARCSRNQLIRQIEFLKAENEMLRKRVPTKAICLKPDERQRLVVLGRAVGPAIKQLITIVHYLTYCRWCRKSVGKVPQKRMGRPRTPQDIRELILRIAKETDWGYTRILGELRKLGYVGISRQTVVNILKENGFNPDSRRGPGSWNELLKREAATLWQCDFFSKRVFSRLGMPQLFAMVFINVATRKVWVSPATRNPTENWVIEQAKAFIDHTEEAGLKVDIVTRDNDQIYKAGFDAVMEGAGIQPKRLSLRSPNLNVYVERFIQTIQVECLDRFLVFGEKHFDYLVREYVEHYHTERPHQGLGNSVIAGPLHTSPPSANCEISCRTRLGGMLKHYSRAAA